MMNLHKLPGSIIIICVLSSFVIQAQHFTGTQDVGISQDFYEMQKKMNKYFKTQACQRIYYVYPKIFQFGRFTVMRINLLVSTVQLT